MGISKLDLWGSYFTILSTIAYKDLYAMLDKKRTRAIDILKQKDDAVARATWVLVDQIDDYIKLKHKEAMDESQSKKENN